MFLFGSWTQADVSMIIVLAICGVIVTAICAYVVRGVLADRREMLDRDLDPPAGRPHPF
jgi:hypothetical protein